MMISYLVKLTNGITKKITADEIKFFKDEGYLRSRIGDNWFDGAPTVNVWGQPKLMRGKRT